MTVHILLGIRHFLYETSPQPGPTTYVYGIRLTLCLLRSSLTEKKKTYRVTSTPIILNKCYDHLPSVQNVHSYTSLEVGYI